MIKSSDCVLPCFAGLEVGKVDTNDIKGFIGQIDYNKVVLAQIGNSTPYNFSLSSGEKGLLTIGLTTQNDTLQRARIGITDPRSWLDTNVFELPNVATDLGVPENVYMAFSGPPLGFTMILVYNKKGVLIRYQATFTQDNLDNNAPLPICFDPKQVDLYQIDVWLQDPESVEAVEKNQPGLHNQNQDVRPFWSLQKAIGLNEVEFAKFLRKTPMIALKGFQPRNYEKKGMISEIHPLHW